MDFFTVNDPAVAWYIVAVILLFTEMVTGGLILGLLFLGIGALVTGTWILYSSAEVSMVTQLAVFFTTSIVIAALLWRPLKRFRNRFSDKPYVNMVGNTAKVVDKPLKKGGVGTVRWSGTFMRARIVSGLAVRQLAPGTTVKIVEVKGNVLHVAPDE